MPADVLRLFVFARHAESGHLLDRTETVTLVVIHDLALRYIAAAAATSLSPLNGTAFPHAVPYLFDKSAARRAAASLAALTSSAQSQSDH